jgi:hypothetical protein
LTEENIAMKFNEIATQEVRDDNAAVSKLSDGRKAYVRPMLTKHGKVSKLTAALTGSNTDTLGGNEIG